MISSPLHSEPSAAFSLLGGMVGIFAIAHGIKTIIKRRIWARDSKDQPFQIVEGKEAFYAGLLSVVVGIFFLVCAIAGLVYIYYFQ